MSTAGSREEMLEALQKAKQAMARRVPVVARQENSADGGALPLHDAGAPPPHVTPRPRPHVPSAAKDNRSHFFDTWCRKIEAFLADPTKTVLELPNDLGANDRRELHGLAEKYNLSHQSRGTGATRQLVLKKDALHYRMPDARPDDIEAMKQSAGSKQSKFHLRRVVQDPDAAVGSIGTFADEATTNMVRRLDRATDEYRKAVEVGYSQEELLALEAGESVEDILRRGDEGGILHTSAVEQAGSHADSVLPAATHGDSEALHGAPTGGRKGRMYDEVCLRCGARARVDYDVQKWECNGYCAQCAMQTIWKLVELDGVTEELVHPPSSKRDRKRGLQELETESPPAMHEPEEIDKNNDEDDTITVEDVVDMASMNDFCAADVNWIRRFAAHHQPQGSRNVLSTHIVFCIEFEDLFNMRIFRDFFSLEDKKHATRDRKRTREESDAKEQNDTTPGGWFLRLREVKESGVPLSTMLEELSLCIPERYDRLAIAFPNMSVYGAAATCVCLIQSNTVQESHLELLQRKYGKRSVHFARDLSAVLLNGSRCRWASVAGMRLVAGAVAAAGFHAAKNTLITRRGCAVLPAHLPADASDGKTPRRRGAQKKEPAPLPHGSHAVSPEGEDAFINPFTGRLTSASSRMAKELLRVGFLQSAVNPFRLTWDAAKWRAAGAAAVRPFETSVVAWRKNLAALLTRQDAADVVAEEVQRLYSELTSAYLPPKLDAMHDPQLSTMKMTPDQENAIRCALRGYNMFVGGGAGTGKTVLLKAMHRRLTEMGLRVAMTATTGVASVQLGGCTFHLAFGVPVGAGEYSKKRWDANALRAVDVVIIDEVSLLDAELFDAFELEARMARLQALPFGGLQVITCGDFLQLASSDSTFSGPCYQSDAFRHLVAVRLVTQMRQAQSDPLYKLLARLRTGKFDRKSFALLDRDVPGDTDNVTYIFPRRRDAQALNEGKLGELRSEEMTFTPQRGPLQLIGKFTPAGLMEFARKKTPADRDEVVRVLTEEVKRVAAVDVVDHNVVVMPTRSDKGGVLIRLRNPDDIVTTRTNGAGGSRSDDNGSGARGGHGRRHGSRRDSPDIPVDLWETILEATAKRLNAMLRRIYEEDPQGFVPISVSMMLADVANHPNAEHLMPLRLKLGCRVMINRNLSRTVSNGSVGVVEAFAAPNPDLFPRRHETPARTTYGRILEKNVFPKLPIVRLLDGEVVQVPPLSLMVGGTPSTFFYGHELYLLPLQLGYGFTVHKVQGLTLQGTVVLDCKNFFECPHLVYVACSRVRSLDQLIVKNIGADMVIVKRSALEFSENLRDASVITNFVPPEGFTRASWLNRLRPRLVGLTE